MIAFRKLSFYVSLLGLCAATAVVIRLRATEPVLPPPVAPPVKPASRGIAASGLVEARRENTNVGVPVPGLVTEVLVKVWDRVEQGQPLLKLDERDLRASLLVQEANVGVAESTVRRVEDQCARLKKLVAGRAASVDDLEVRTNDVAIAKAQLSAARAAVAQLTRCWNGSSSALRSPAPFCKSTSAPGSTPRPPHKNRPSCLGTLTKSRSAPKWTSSWHRASCRARKPPAISRATPRVRSN